MLLLLEEEECLNLFREIRIQVIRDSLRLSYQLPILALCILHEDLDLGIRFAQNV